MNIKTTLALLILSGGCVALFLFGPRFAPKLGLAPKPLDRSDLGTAKAVAAIQAEQIVHLQVSQEGKDLLELKSPSPGLPLELVDKWPVRPAAVADLVRLLTNLKSRFDAIPLRENEKTKQIDLKPFGLDPSQKPIQLVVTVIMDGDGGKVEKKFRLTIGEPSGDSNQPIFSSSNYLRWADWSKGKDDHWEWVERNEVLRLGSDVYRVVGMMADSYRRRQLFPDVTRLKIAETSATGDNSPAAADMTITNKPGVTFTIDVTGPAGPYTLSQMKELAKPKPPENRPSADPFITMSQVAQAWNLTRPVQDRVNPAKVTALLTAMPEIWVERFYPGTIPIDETGLDDKAEPTPLTLTVTFSDDPKNPRRLIIGKQSRSTVEETVEMGQPQFPGAPPQPRIKRTVIAYRYAKLEKTPLIFDIRTDKLNDLFFLNPPVNEDPMALIPPKPIQLKAVDELRDTTLVRFDPSQINAIEVAVKQQPRLEIDRREEDGLERSQVRSADNWEIKAPFSAAADSTETRTLLTAVAELKADKNDILEVGQPPLARMALLGGIVADDWALTGLSESTATRIALTPDPKSGLPAQTLYLGSLDASKQKGYARVKGWDRIYKVAATSRSTIERQARVYRSRNLFDTSKNRVTEVTVLRNASETFQIKDGPKGWELFTPQANETDTSKAGLFVKDLTGLTALEYLEDAPSEVQLMRTGMALGGAAASVSSLTDLLYGFDKPTLRLGLKFTGDKPVPDEVVEIGKARAGKPEYYARHKGILFTVSDSIPKLLQAGSVAFLPLKLWEGASADLTQIEIRRGTEPPYMLNRVGDGWAITAPFTASVSLGQLAPLTGSLARVQAERYETSSTTDLKRYGLDTPALRIQFTMAKPVLVDPKTDKNDPPVVVSRTLLIGNAEAPDKPNRYAKLESSPAIFVVPEILFKDADKSVFDFLDRSLLTVGTASIVKLQTTGSDGTISFVKDGTNWKPEGVAFPIDKPTLDTIFLVLSNLSASKFVAYGPTVKWADYGLDEPAKPVTLVVTQEKGVHKIEIGKPLDEKAPAGDRFARIDGGQAVAVLPGRVAVALRKGKLDFADRTLIQFKKEDDVQSLRRAMDKQDLELKQNAAGGWSITKPTMLKADAGTMEELVDRLGNLRADSIKSVDAKNLGDFGLAPAVATWKIELLDAKSGKAAEKGFLIGKPVDPTKPDGDRYIAADGSSLIGVLNGAFAKRLLAPPLKFQDRSLAEFVSADKIVLEDGDRKVVFLKGSGAWKLKEPLEADTEEEALRELHDALARLTADELVADKPTDWKPYGLDKPTRWQLFNGDKEVLNLLIGKRDGDRIYAKLDKGSTVVLLDPLLTKKLTGEYRKRALWDTLDVAQAAQISSKTADGPGSFVLIKSPLGWEDPTNASQRLGNETVSDFLGAMANLKADAFVADKNADLKLYGLDKPRTLTITTQSGQKRTLLLGNLSESKRVYAKLDDPKRTDVFLLSEADTKRINRDRAAFNLTVPKQ